MSDRFATLPTPVRTGMRAAQRWLALLLLLAVAGCGGPAGVAGAGEAAPALGSEPTPQRILVIGGTSGVGLETVKLALSRGHEVTAMARRPDRMTLSHPRLTVLKGDVTIVDDVAKALDGQQSVVFTIGIKPTNERVTVFSRGTENVLSQMAEDGSQYLLMVTGIGAGDSRGHGGFFYDQILNRFVLRTMYEDKDRSEAMIVASSVPWTIVRPGFLTDEESTARYRLVRDMEGITAGDISRADVAHYLVGALETRTHEGQTLLLSE